MITEKTYVVVPEHTTHEKMDDTTVILNVQTGRIFQLNDVGTRMWDILLMNEAAAGLEPVMTMLLDEYDVSRDSLWDELAKFLHELEQKGLIELASAD